MKTMANLREAPHWSYTALNTYLQCPLKYRFRYIDKVPAERTSACFPFGRAFHAALSERARQGKTMSEHEVCDVFETFFHAETSAAEKLVYKPSETYDSLLETGFKMVEAACGSWQDDYTVKSVAEPFSVTIPRVDKPLIGEFDLVVEDGGSETVVDWKTSSSRWPMGKADYERQATAYCYAYRARYRRNPLFRYDVITKAKLPQIGSWYTVRTEDELARFEELCRQVDNCVKAGVFYRNESQMNCGDCPYRDRCRKGGGK